MDHIIILAGGKGTRMKTDLPKVLNKLKGVSFIKRVVLAATKICKKPTIIVGYKGEDVIKETNNKYHYVWQREQLGTGHAIMCAKEDLINQDIDTILVLNGDHPLVKSKTLKDIISSHKKSRAVLSISSIITPSFEGDFSMFLDFGRIVRDENKNIKGIVESKDAKDDEKQIREVNVSYYCFDAKWLWQNIKKIANDNKAGEYYLTDLVKIAFSEEEKINSYIIKDPSEGIGVNNMRQLEVAKKHCKSFLLNILNNKILSKSTS